LGKEKVVLPWGKRSITQSGQGKRVLKAVRRGSSRKSKINNQNLVGKGAEEAKKTPTPLKIGRRGKREKGSLKRQEKVWGGKGLEKKGEKKR